MTRWIITSVLTAAAFFAGRALTRHDASAIAKPGIESAPETVGAAARPTMTASGTAASVAPALTTPRPQLATGEPRALGRQFYREWLEAVRTNARGAMAIHQAVLHELERRRRSATQLGTCIEPGSIGLLVLRFAVNVEVYDDRLRIRSAHFFEVASGMPISERSAHCLEEALDGDVYVEATDERFHVGYIGRVDYIAQLDLGDGTAQ